MSDRLHTHIAAPRKSIRWVLLSSLAPLLIAAISAAAPPTTVPFHNFPQPLDHSRTADPATWWSLKPLKRPNVPTVAGPGDAAVNPIDAFVLSKLRDKGLAHSPEADRRTLIRRLTFDLHGLPPTPREIDEFVGDNDPRAYEHLVDRLLASPRYGERMGRLWLDVVHYGESNGYGMDRPRMNAWPYRDYVIRSFNQDKPYARFVQEQIAADALFPDEPGAIAALGFIAAGPFNQSALVEQVRGTQCWKIALNLDRDDMVSNVSASFLSVTLHCARCHDHKFDPITQRDYYRMQSVFAGVTRGDREFDDSIATTRDRKRWLAVGQQLKGGAALSSLAHADQAELLAVEPAAEKALLATEQQWRVLDVSAVADASMPKVVPQADGSVCFDGKPTDKVTYTVTARTPLESVAALRLEIPDHAAAALAAADQESFRLSEIHIDATSATTPAKIVPVKISAAVTDFSEKGSEIEKAIDGKPGTAWGIHPQEGQSHQAVFFFQKPVAYKGGARFTIRLDQMDGSKHAIRQLRLSAVTHEPSPAQIVSPHIIALLKIPPVQRPAPVQRMIDESLARMMAEQKLAALPAVHQVFAIGHDLPALRSYRLTPEMSEIHILNRGDVNKPMDTVQPGALAAVTFMPVDFIPPTATDESPERAALAKWITDSRNPLTWRSIANRVWLWHFDRGIVDTPNDFGKMGTLPSHPELLDWLACELRDTGGSIKRLHRLIVTSATYRQSSPPNEMASKLDGDNRLLWRMNRHRVDAEQLRDALLAISGKLDLTMGGPPAMQFSYSDPNVAVTPRIDYDTFAPAAPASYRRSVYRFLFRNINDPLLEAFDASNPSLATPKRNVTTTALQTLSLFNNRFVLRQCEHLAARLERESSDVTEQIHLAYVLMYGRPPTTEESALIAEYAHKHGLAQACRILVNANEFLFVP